MFRSEKHLFVYQITSNNKSGSGYYELEKADGNYRVLKEKKGALLITKNYVNIYRRVVLRKPNAKD